MNIIGIIPARLGSSRFPGKPLASLNGMPMIEHVYHRSAMAKSLSDVYVATCDSEIKRAVESFKGKAVMTKDSHERASDRTAEAVSKIEKATNKPVDVVVMIQGDEPLVWPEMIDAAVAPIINDSGIQVTNLMGILKTKEEQEDVNQIKVVTDSDQFALYFSRSPIPACRGNASVKVFKQVCIIGFRRDFLVEYTRMSPTPLEVAESIDMLRILENGKRVKMVLTPFETYSVDTKEDLRKVESFMKNDPLFKKYAKSVLMNR